MNPKKQRSRVPATTIVAGLVVIFVLITLAVLPNTEVLLHAQGGLYDTIPIEGNFWMPNGGWINLQGENFGMSMSKESRDGPLNTFYYDIYGYAWAPNLGWISFHDPDGNYGVYVETNDPDYPIEGQGPWNIEGYAWAPNIGWIDFDAIDNSNPAEQPRIVLDGLWSPDAQVLTASLEGYAWSPNFGWVDLSYANIPGWIDISNPELISWSASPEVVANPDQPYLDGVYTEQVSDFNGFSVGNFVWVRDDTKFKLQLDTTDNAVRWQSLMIANLNAVDYYWKDKLRFMPGNSPYFSGSLPDPPIDSFFKRNADYPAGFNPTALDPPQEPWQQGDDPFTWKSISHIHADTGLSVEPDIQTREIRVAARDSSGNDVCQSDYQWGDWDNLKGCQISNTYGPLTKRVGIAIDPLLPTAGLYYGTEQYESGDHIPTEQEPTLTFMFGDTSSSGARWGRISWSWDKASWNVLAERDSEFAGRNPVFENFILPNIGGNDGDILYFRFEVYDNVGNLLDTTLDLVVDNTPPSDQFQAQDPKDFDPDRTRFQKVNMYIPAPAAGDDVQYVRFGNPSEKEGEYYWGLPVYYGSKTWPTGRPLGDKSNPFYWDLNLGETGINPILYGGNKLVAAEFADSSKPPNTETKTYIIKAPWFQAAGGDIHAGTGVGTPPSLNVGEGIGPYSTDTYNATFRITADGRITRQILTESDWEQQYYEANFTYPGPSADSIAQIDWDALVEKAAGNVLREKDICDPFTNTCEIDFNDYLNSGGVVMAEVDPGRDPVFTIGEQGKDVTIKGRGTLLVPATLYVASDLYYEDQIVENVSDLSSMGVVTKRSVGLVADGSRGNLYVDEGVNHMVGSYILGIGKCESFSTECDNTGIIHTSVYHDPTGFGADTYDTKALSDQELVLNGLVIARGFDLGRYSAGSQNFLQNADFSDSPFGPGSFPDLPSDWFIEPDNPDTYTTIDSEKVGAENLGEAVFQIWQSATFGQVFGIPSAVDIPEEITDNFTASVYLKGNHNMDGVLSIGVGQQICADKVSITTEWERYQCQVTGVKPGIKGLMYSLGFNLPPESIVYIAAPQAEFGDRATAWHRQYDDALSYSGSSEHFYYDGRAVMNTPPGFYSLSSSSWGEATAD